MPNSSDSTKYEIIRSSVFVNEIVDEASKTEKRFYAQSMLMDMGHFSNTLEEIFTSLRKKDVDCRLNIDSFSLMLMEGENEFLNGFSDSPMFKEKIAYYQRLRDIGVKVSLLNKPNLAEKIFPYSGRNHSKMIISDGISYVGGLNFSDADISNEDFMIRINDSGFTQKLSEVFEDFSSESIKNDMEINYSQDLNLFVDSGRKNKSLILSTALDIINNAQKSVKHANQFYPDGKLLKALNSVKKRGADVELIVPRKNDYNFAFKVLYKLNKLSGGLSSLNPFYFSKDLHIKLTIVDDRVAIFGSHNLIGKGVLIGTSEIAIITENEKLVTDLSEYFESVKKKSSLI